MKLGKLNTLSLIAFFFINGCLYNSLGISAENFEDEIPRTTPYKILWATEVHKKLIENVEI